MLYPWSRRGGPDLVQVGRAAVGRRRPGPELGYSLAVDVHAQHIVAGGGQACRGNGADAPKSDDGYLHLLPRLPTPSTLTLSQAWERRLSGEVTYWLTTLWCWPTAYSEGTTVPRP